MKAKSARELFERVVAPNLDEDAVNQLLCAERYGYVALGCDAQKHRGPTAFAMLLAFSGCTAEHAAGIANGIWGLNGVAAEVRLAVAQAGQDLGHRHAESRKRLQAKFSEPVPAVSSSNVVAPPR